MVAVLLAAAAMILMGSGCDDDEPHSEGYRIVDIEVDADDGDDPWMPAEKRVQMWFASAVGDDNGLVSTRTDGRDVTAELTHRVRRHSDGNATRLVVDVNVRLRPAINSDDNQPASLHADTMLDEVISDANPDNGQLSRTARQLSVRSVEKAAEQLELRARLDRGEDRQIVDWIADESADPLRRKQAMQWVADATVTVDNFRVQPKLVEATEDEHHGVAITAGRTLVAIDADDAAHLVMDRAQEASRSGDYDRFLQWTPLLDELDEQWISIYLQTVADAHDEPRVRQKVRHLIDDESPPAAQF